MERSRAARNDAFTAARAYSKPLSTRPLCLLPHPTGRPWLLSRPSGRGHEWHGFLCVRLGR